MVTWSEGAADFAGDGSLRDIYVLDGGEASWNALLRIARKCEAKFSIGGEAVALPNLAREVFARRHAGAALLSIDWKGIDLAAHFFDEAQLELDFVPNVSTNPWPDGCSMASACAVIGCGLPLPSRARKSAARLPGAIQSVRLVLFRSNFHKVP